MLTLTSTVTGGGDLARLGQRDERYDDFLQAGPAVHVFARRCPVYGAGAGRVVFDFEVPVEPELLRRPGGERRMVAQSPTDHVATAVGHHLVAVAVSLR